MLYYYKLKKNEVKIIVVKLVINITFYRFKLQLLIPHLVVNKASRNKFEMKNFNIYF